ncbi:MAG: polysaccharide deacetylase family protein [Bradymonadales bacterium]|nr:polysaccharide deacetylase family protein [Bradymonadales bacterium]
MNNQSAYPGGKPLLVSIHDVSPVFAERIEKLLDLLRDAGISPGSLLIVPDYHGRGSWGGSPAFVERIRQLADSGWELVLHGFTHREEHAAFKRTLGERLAARHLTDREGEFLSLDGQEIRRRLQTGRALVEATFGKCPQGFVAPAWLRTEELDEYLRESGFLYTEGHLFLEQLATGRKIFSPVLAWASRTPGRLLASRVWARLATPWLTRLPVARVALHPGDTTHETLLASIRTTLDRLTRAGFVPSTYRGLLTGR